MLHSPYFRDVEGADTAFLFIHGIMGSPAHFNKFIPLLPQDVTIHNILLDGHGKTMRDFSQSSMRKWREQVRAEFISLSKNHKKIFVVAHSMGTLFAFENSFLFNDKISHMFLLASPLSTHVKPSYIPIYLNIAFKRYGKESDLQRDVRMQCSIDLKPSPFNYIPWLPRYIELFKRIIKTNRHLNKVTVPCTIFQSELDELVSLKSCKILNENPNFSVHTLKKSSHAAYSESDMTLLLSHFVRLIN